MPSMIRNFFYNTLLTVANLVFPLIIFIYVSRIIGPESLGKVNFATTLTSYFILIALFGMGNYGIREIARVRDDQTKLKKTFNELFAINCITVSTAIMAYFVFVVLNMKTKSEPILYLINGISVLMSLFSFDWLFQGLENYRYISIRSITVKIISVILVFVFVRSKNDYLIYALLTVLGLSSNYLFNVFYANKIIGIDFRGLNISKHFPVIARFALISFATSLYLGMDKLFLGFMSGDYYVGIYTPAEKIARLSLSLVAALSAVLFPRLSNAFARGDVEGAKVMISDSLHALLLIAIPIFVAIELLAEPLVLLISGKAFMSAILTLRIESLIIIPVTIANVAGIQVLVGSGKEDKYLVSILSGAAVFIVSGLLFIPSMKQNGAAISLASAETVGAILELYFGRSHFRGIKCAGWLMSILLASAFMAGLIFILLRLHLNTISLIMASFFSGAFVYFVILLCCKDSIVLRIKARFFSRFL